MTTAISSSRNPHAVPCGENPCATEIRPLASEKTDGTGAMPHPPPCVGLCFQQLLTCRGQATSRRGLACGRPVPCLCSRPREGRAQPTLWGWDTASSAWAAGHPPHPRSLAAETRAGQWPMHGDTDQPSGICPCPCLVCSALTLIPTCTHGQWPPADSSPKSGAGSFFSQWLRGLRPRTH